VSEDITGNAPTKNIEIFDIRPGDCSENDGWSDCDNDRERSELTERNKTTGPGKQYWYGWSIYFPEDYPNVYPTKVALGQFHQDDGPPVWMFQNSSGGYHLDQQISGQTIKYFELLSDKELRGQWHQVELHVGWAGDNTGFFNVWINGEQKVQYTGRTMNSDDRSYFKYGIYRTYLTRYMNRNSVNEVPAQKVYYSNVKRGSSREAIQAKQ
jgi:hypothetical protein